jgi:hypothetical protein
MDWGGGVILLAVEETDKFEFIYVEAFVVYELKWPVPNR